MGLTKLSGYTGEAEILGQVISVQYQNGALTLYGLDLAQSYAAIDRLATGGLVAVRPPHKDGAPASTPVKEPKKEAVGQVTNNVVQMPAPEKKAEPAKAAEKPAEKEDPALEFPPKEKVAEQPAAPPAPIPGAEDMPDKVRTTGRFIEVMDWVMKKHGFKPTQVDEIVAQCEKLRDHVKVVSRVRDMKDKVTSNLTAYQEAGAAGA